MHINTESHVEIHQFVSNIFIIIYTDTALTICNLEQQHPEGVTASGLKVI